MDRPRLSEDMDEDLSWLRCKQGSMSLTRAQGPRSRIESMMWLGKDAARPKGTNLEGVPSKMAERPNRVKRAGQGGSDDKQRSTTFVMALTGNAHA